MKNAPKIILFYAFGLFFCTFIYAQEKIRISKDDFYANISNRVSFLEDKGRKLKIQDILSEQYQTKFAAYRRNSINFSYTKSTYWIKVEITNATHLPAIMEALNMMRYNYFYFYSVSDKHSIHEEKYESRQNFKQKNLLTVYHTFLVPANSQNTYYFCMNNDFIMGMDLYLYTYPSYISQNHYKSLLNGIYYGFVILIVFFNLFIYISVGDKIYLSYSLAVASSSLSFLNVFGLGFEFLWYNYPVFNFYLPAVAGVSTILNLVFILHFFKISPKEIRWFGFVYAFIFLFILTCFFNFTGGLTTALKISQVLVLSLNLFAFVLSFVKYFAGFRSAKFFILAWFFLILSRFISILFANGLFINHPILYEIVLLGSALEIMLLAFALADRIKIERQERKKIEQEQLLLLEENDKILREQNQVLEQKVAERTQEIQKQNEALISKQDEIIIQNEELMQSSEELSAQRDKLAQQNEIIEIQNQQLRQAGETLEKTVNERTLQLSQSNLELIQNNVQLEQFAHITAHNLRSPVARLLGLVNIFDFQNISNSFNLEILNHIHNTAQDMDEVIRDLNNILEIKKGGQFSFEKVNLCEIINELKETLENEIKENEVKIKTDFREVSEIFAIQVYLKSILHQLLHNAIKYKFPERKLQIEIKTTLKKDEICLSIKDNGLGMDLKQYGEKVFGLYQRFHLHKEGKGLGLYLVKTQIEAMKARIDVESSVNTGTEFLIYFQNHN